LIKSGDESLIVSPALENIVALMPITQTEIIVFEQRLQQAVEKLVLPIQREFVADTTRDEQPDLIDIKGVFQTGLGNFWVALRNNDVVGTVGVVDIGGRMVALKKMFVHKSCRGKDHGVSRALMECAKHWCRDKDIRTILLGTTAQMKAAHRFYEKNGFVEVEKCSLPSRFPVARVDSKFYRCDL
jgi:N-acetylglutamate synthase-like GNAT family acetyltransferase